jgi:hypothetical protein
MPQGAAATRVLEMMHQITSVKETNVSSWTKAYMVPILLLLLLLTPAIVGVGVALVVVRAVLGTLRAILWTHKTKSVWQGLAFAPGLVYKCVTMQRGAPSGTVQPPPPASAPAPRRASVGEPLTHAAPPRVSRFLPTPTPVVQDRVCAEQVRVRAERLGPGALGQLLPAQLGRVRAPTHAAVRV